MNDAEKKAAQKVRSAAYYAANKALVKEQQRLYHIANKAKRKRQRAARYAANPEPFYARQLRLIGWTYAEYVSARREQRGRCAICRCKPQGRLHADHNHVTGKRRGLLCRACNLALGGFRDCPKRLRAAIQYLRR